MGMNRYEVIGNLGKDPVINTTAGGLKIATISVATSEYAGKDGSRQAKYETVWHTVKCFAELAEYVSNNIAKGDTVFASGRMVVETWDKKDGAGKGFAVILQVGKLGKIERLTRRTNDVNAKSADTPAGDIMDDSEIPF